MTLAEKKDLRREIEEEIRRLKTMDMSESERKMAIENIKVLYDLLNESNKQSFVDNFVKIAALGVQALGVIVPALVYTSFLDKGFKFEEEGVYTSGTFKNLTGRLRPTSF